MSKKVLLVGLLALALVVSVAGVALAAAPGSSTQSTGVADPPNPPGPRGGPGRGQLWQPPHLRGEVISIPGTGSFTMAVGEDDREITVQVDEMTSYIGNLTAFADLHVGDEIAVDGHREDGSLMARVIIDTEALPLGIPVGGEVTAVTSSKLTLEIRGGLSMSFTVDSGTDYLSRESAAPTIADIEVGDHVVVVFEQASNGTLTANLVLVGGQPEGEEGG